MDFPIKDRSELHEDSYSVKNRIYSELFGIPKWNEIRRQELT